MSLPLDVTLLVLLAALIGCIVLREGFGALRIAGAVLVAGGIVALRL